MPEQPRRSPARLALLIVLATAAFALLVVALFTG
jgi:hypothetical protein